MASGVAREGGGSGIASIQSATAPNCGTNRKSAIVVKRKKVTGVVSRDQVLFIKVEGQGRPARYSESEVRTSPEVKGVKGQQASQNRLDLCHWCNNCTCSM